VSTQPEPVDSEQDTDPHADCTEPHRGSDGEYVDCDGKPL